MGGWFKNPFQAAKDTISNPFVQQAAASQGYGTPNMPSGTGGGFGAAPPGAQQFGFDVAKDYYNKRGTTSTGAPDYTKPPLDWAGPQAWNQVFGADADPAGQIFGKMYQNNPLATGAGKYTLPLLELLNTPEFKQMRDFQNNPEWKRLESMASPDLYLKKAIPGINTAINQAGERGRGALARGGLAGSGAEAALEGNLGYSRAKAQGEAATASEDYANQVSQWLFGTRQKTLGDIASYRQGVMKDIVGAAVESKLQPGQNPDWGAAAGGAAGIAKLIAAVA